MGMLTGPFPPPPTPQFNFLLRQINNQSARRDIVMLVTQKFDAFGIIFPFTLIQL